MPDSVETVRLSRLMNKAVVSVSNESIIVDSPVIHHHWFRVRLFPWYSQLKPKVTSSRESLDLLLVPSVTETAVPRCASSTGLNLPILIVAVHFLFICSYYTVSTVTIMSQCPCIIISQFLSSETIFPHAVY